jgi:hypothetical protein
MDKPAQDQQARRLSGRRVLVPLAILVMVTAAALAFFVLSNRRAVHAFNRGPLQAGASTRTGMVADELGQVFTYGGVVLTNTSSRPAVLEEIRVVPPPGEGMKIVAIQAAGADRQLGLVGTDQQFPPADLAPFLRPYRETVVPPERTPGGEEGVEIVFGLRIDQPGNFGFREVHVDYRVGKKRHTVRLEDGFIGCAPLARFPDGCDFEKFFGLEQ